MASFTSSNFLEKLRKGFPGYSSCSKTAPSGFFDALVEQKEFPPQRCFQRVAEAVSKQQTPLSAGAVHESLRLLSRVSESQRLNLALTYYYDEAARVKLEAELKDVISKIEQGTPRRGQDSLSLLLEADLEVFSQWCMEVGELYIYFTFLDVKGDRSLLMLVAKRLQSLLAVTSISSLVANLKRTRPWAERAWQMMAQQQESMLLERLHSKTLMQWLVVAKDTVVRSVAESGVRSFWDSCFSGLQRVPWHDLVDSLQEQFFKGFCPKDLLEPLRRRVATKSYHHVTRQHWEQLLETYDHSITNILDVLLEEVLDEISSKIYRSVVQREDCRQSSASASTNGRSRTKRDSGSRTPRVPESPPKSAAESCFGQEMERMGVEGSHTPEDPRLHMRPVEAGRKIEWATYVEELCRTEMRWWTETEGATQKEEKLRLSALRAVNSDLVCTRKALVLRVASGELAKDRPVLDFGGEPQQLPAVLISPNDITMFAAVTKFGRGSKRKMLPDMNMNEPIASRSHFSISFDAQSQRYEIMDAGSKWGTFVKVGCGGLNLSCGDWIRIGNAELVIRYCGGGCKSKRHMESYPGSLRISQLQWLPGLRPSSLHTEEEPGPEDENIAHCASLLSGRTRPWWSNQVDKMCQNTALQSAKTRMNPTTSHTAPTPLPWSPMELDFVSGPNMGERLMITERHCTIGRADSCTIQISDPMLANVSRTHCIIQNTGRGAKIMDNNSTNGTWKRLSCVLEPSDPQELKNGTCILAGVHEFRIEEAEMPCDWIPSVAGRTLQLASEMYS